MAKFFYALQLYIQIYAMPNYRTISDAMNGLIKRGYTIDLGIDGIQSHKTTVSLAPDRFGTTVVYRFEGEADPDDEAVVCAIQSHDGHKGTLVVGYGVSADPVNGEMIRKLPSGSDPCRYESFNDDLSQPFLKFSYAKENNNQKTTEESCGEKEFTQQKI